MAVGAGESLVATGGADATVVLWHDYTAEDQAAAAEEEETIVLRQQDLANALHVRPCPTNSPGPTHIFEHQTGAWSQEQLCSDGCSQGNSVVIAFENPQDAWLWWCRKGRG